MTVTNDGSCTVTVALSAAAPELAVTTAVPLDVPRISPVASTETMFGALDDHLMAAPVTVCPLASVAMAASRSVSPTETVSESISRSTAETACRTITVALALASPALAVIVAVPLPVAATRPVPSTVATDASDDDHATGWPSMTRASWSRTSATRRTVSPSDAKRTVSGATVRVVGTAAMTVSSARPVTPCAVAVTSASPAPTPVTRPASSTTATSVSLDAHENPAPATGRPFVSAA